MVEGSLSTDADVSPRMECIAPHGVGDPVLEGDAEEFVLVLPSQRLDEEAGPEFDVVVPRFQLDPLGFNF